MIFINNKSIFVIGFSIILGFCIVAVSLFISLKENHNRYQFFSPNDSNIIIFDSHTGTYWNKFINPSEGPTDWTKEELDFLYNK
ncbi:hypothetical protein PN290_07025 [Romboutsia sp. 1001216sp1]|nr:hypothetical protein [Romboutsia sp. 1001216sp1]